MRTHLPNVLTRSSLPSLLPLLFILIDLLLTQDSRSCNNDGLVGFVGCSRNALDTTDETPVGADTAKDDVLVVEMRSGDTVTASVTSWERRTESGLTS